ncbi:MAG: type II toxin-antitoxin system YafQ family toxin [Oscillospiraceae bacterium]|nr:type II toxin-antitoxin system YafQ family toxin [Oscillospiraceae bacterium]
MMNWRELRIESIRVEGSPSSKFRRTRKLAQKQGLDMDLLDWTIDQLARDIPLPTNWKDHQLKGSLKRLRECHVDSSGDWLLIVS